MVQSSVDKIFKLLLEEDIKVEFKYNSKEENIEIRFYDERPIYVFKINRSDLNTHWGNNEELLRMALEGFDLFKDRLRHLPKGFNHDLI